LFNVGRRRTAEKKEPIFFVFLFSMGGKAGPPYLAGWYFPGPTLLPGATLWGGGIFGKGPSGKRRALERVKREEFPFFYLLFHRFRGFFAVGKSIARTMGV
jgi:hypothetical protein